MWNEPIDIYCERLDATFWAEPINAITNIAFIIASLLAFKLYAKEDLKSYVFIFLASLVFLIGVGSFLFHTFANTWSSLADTIPIWSFVVFYVMFCIRYVFNNSWFKTARVMLVVLVFAYLGFDLSQSDSEGAVPLNGSIQYAPALFFLAVFAVALYLKRIELSRYAFYALGVFFLSLIFRTMDMDICGSIEFGTHFMWHILNGMMLYYLLVIMLKALVRNKSLNL